MNVKTSTFFYLGRSCFFKQNVKLPFLKRGFQVDSHGLPSTSFIWHSPNMSVCYFGKPTLLNMLERPVSLIFSVLPNICMFILMYSSTGTAQTSLTIRAPQELTVLGAEQVNWTGLPLSYIFRVCSPSLHVSQDQSWKQARD